MWRMWAWPALWWLHYGTGLAMMAARGPLGAGPLRCRTPILTLHVCALALRPAHGMPATGPRCRLYLVRRNDA